MLFLLFTPIFAHLHMIEPKPTFTNGQGNENAPSAQCSVVKYAPNSPAAVLADFKQGSSKFASLKDYLDVCGAKKCGNTVSSKVVPVPSENKVKLTVGARH